MSAIHRLGLEKNDLIGKELSENQKMTRDSFQYKWSRRESYESPAVQQKAQDWLFERYCQSNSALLDSWLVEKPQIILDAGCGSGFSALLFFGDRLNQHNYLGVDISESVSVAKNRFKEQNIQGEFFQSDLITLPVPDQSLDMIFSEGVLHHTDQPEQTFAYLCKKLKSKGRFLFYVYAKKSVIREFTDDFIRETLKPLSDEQAWEELESLTLFGKLLGELNLEINIEKDINLLGIKSGKHDIQRLFYWHICKMFYQKDFNLDEMNHINFDWFRPMNCFRYTPDEISNWCMQNDLSIEHMDIQDAGISVVAKKN